MNTPKAKATTLEMLERFCQQQSLPDSYKNLAERYFLPLANELAKKSEQSSKPLFIGINGSQGSGKSTLAALLCGLLTTFYDKSTCNLSIDDFYHTRATRSVLAKDTHPLLQTRGVPGTHDTALLEQTLKHLANPEASKVAIPRFNKATDDRHESIHWDVAKTPVDIVFLEGWCVGVSTQDDSALATPCNMLESDEDSDGRWRQYVNKAIDKSLTPIFERFDQLIMLKAPSFDCVFQWRRTQEEKLRQRLPEGADQSGIMDDAALARFIQHYQRLTEHMLATLPSQADVIFILNKEHDVTDRINNG